VESSLTSPIWWVAQLSIPQSGLQSTSRFTGMMEIGDSRDHQPNPREWEKIGRQRREGGIKSGSPNPPLWRLGRHIKSGSPIVVVTFPHPCDKVTMMKNPSRGMFLWGESMIIPCRRTFRKCWPYNPTPGLSTPTTIYLLEVCTYREM